jgi:hypothetical protein
MVSSSLSSAAYADYQKPLTALLDAGDLAYTGASKLNADGKWAYNWYFFLPLGMPWKTAEASNCCTSRRTIH